MSRTRTLRERANWAQWQMAAYLGLSQPAVSTMETQGRESGPVSRLLDHLEASLDAGVVPAPVPSNDAGPAQQEDVA